MGRLNTVTLMSTEPNSTAFDKVMGFLQSLQFFALILVLPAYNYVNKYFQSKKEQNRDFIKSVVKEGMGEATGKIEASIQEIRADITELRRLQERDKEDIKAQQLRDREKFNEQIIQLIRERK